MEKRSIWDRSNAFEALKANHASLIIITFLQAIIGFCAFLKTGLLPNDLMQADTNPRQTLNVIEVASFLLVFTTGMVLLLLSHYYNRYGAVLSFKDKNFPAYLWRFVKRTLFFTILVFIASALIGIVIGVGFALLKDLFSSTSGVFMIGLLGILLAIAFIAFIIFLILFSMMIYPPLLGDNEDKSFKTAFENTKLIFVKFNKETFLFYLIWIIIFVVVGMAIENLIKFSEQDGLLSKFHQIVIFFAIYFTTYMNVFATFVTQIFASQYYLELQGKKEEVSN